MSHVRSPRGTTCPRTVPPPSWVGTTPRLRGQGGCREAYDLPWRLDELRPLLRQWEYVYNHIRQVGYADSALGGKTPIEYLKEKYPEIGSQKLVSHMY